MLCSNCGMDVPFVGNVCPHCRAPKQRDQAAQLLGVICGVGGAAAGFLAGVVTWGVAGAGWGCFCVVVGPFVGLAAGAFTGTIIALATSAPPRRRPRDDDDYEPAPRRRRRP